MENRPTETGEGACIISEEVLEALAGKAAMEIDGVGSLAPKTDFKRFFDKKRRVRSVHISREEDALVVDVYITIKHTARVPEVAGRVQQNVKTAIESMTGRPVGRVNVHIMDLSFVEPAALP